MREADVMRRRYIHILRHGRLSMVNDRIRLITHSRILESIAILEDIAFTSICPILACSRYIFFYLSLVKTETFPSEGHRSLASDEGLFTAIYIWSWNGFQD